MMRIAICDKNESSSENLKKYIYNYANRNHLDLLVSKFKSGEELIKTNLNYSLVFLEYSLPGINGLDTAKIIRKINKNVSIVFLSNNIEFVFEAFKVSTYRFLTKPLNIETLFETLDSFFKNCRENSMMWIKDSENTVCLKKSDIIYLEADNKHCFVHLESEKITCKKTMAKVAEVINDPSFYKINRAYIVNLNHINKYNNDLVHFKNGQSVHISRNYLSGFKEYYKGFCNPIIP